MALRSSSVRAPMTSFSGEGEMTKAQSYDAAECLETDEDIVAYLNAALEDGDPSLVAAALSDILKAHNR